MNTTILEYNFMKTGNISRFISHKKNFKNQGCKYLPEAKYKNTRSKEIVLRRRKCFIKNKKIVFVRGMCANYACIWKGIQNPICYTFFREPVDRIYSHFNHLRNLKNSQIYKKRHTNQIFSNPDFWRIHSQLNNKYINYKAHYPFVSNLYTRGLSPYGQFNYFMNSPNKKMFERVKKNLKNNVIEMFGNSYNIVKVPFFVCLYEEYGKSIDLLNDMFDLRLNKSIRMHVTKVKDEPFNEESLRYLKKYNAYDIELYEIIKEKFQQYN